VVEDGVAAVDEAMILRGRGLFERAGVGMRRERGYLVWQATTETSMRLGSEASLC